MAEKHEEFIDGHQTCLMSHELSQGPVHKPCHREMYCLPKVSENLLLGESDVVIKVFICDTKLVNQQLLIQVTFSGGRAYKFIYIMNSVIRFH